MNKIGVEKKEKIVSIGMYIYIIFGHAQFLGKYGGAV